MGEAKNKRDRMTEHDRLVQAVSRELADKGKLIEAGFAALRKLWVPADAPADQVADLRMAFMAGAQHLFTSILVTVDRDREPTAKDMDRMRKISAELDGFALEMERELTPRGAMQ